jgi:hypothetical protein
VKDWIIYDLQYVAIGGGINPNYIDYVNISSKLFNRSYTSYNNNNNNNNNKMQIYKCIKSIVDNNTSMDPAKRVENNNNLVKSANYKYGIDNIIYNI